MKLLLTSLLLAVSAQFASAEQYCPLCQFTREMSAAAAVYGDNDISTQVHAIMRKACACQLDTRNSVYYPNGEMLALTPSGGAGFALYWPNGTEFTSSSGSISFEWSWPNGQRMTNRPYELEVGWYWPNGNEITTFAGKKGHIYLRSNGTRMRTGGPDCTNQYGKLDTLKFLHYVFTIR